MAGKLVERRTSGDRTYEVRREGRTLCLYTNGVLHTAYEEGAPVLGRVWDLIALPGLVTRASSFLVLGVGGGAAIRQWLAFGEPSRIDGVDLDEVHLQLARAHFGLSDPRVVLHHEDARSFVARSTETYDCVVDDVFGETEGSPHRAIAYDDAWARAVLARLAPTGVLVVNHASEREIRDGVLADEAFLAHFASVFGLTTSTAGNVVLALFRRPITDRLVRAEAKRALGPHAEALDLKIRTRRRA